MCLHPRCEIECKKEIEDDHEFQRRRMLEQEESAALINLVKESYDSLGMFLARRSRRERAENSVRTAELEGVRVKEQEEWELKQR